ncbi:MAG TPA: ABC transporter permease [Candidatus Binataceae bacterium]|nr:ABC transporter permease [Candidatus Binataceae bacterium]
MRLSDSLSVIFRAATVSGAGVRRDRRRLVSLFLVPTVVMAVVGFAMGGYSSASFEVGLLDQANTIESRALAAALVSNEHFHIRDYTNEERLKIAVFRGRMNAGLLIPPGWHGDQNLPLYLSTASGGAPAVVQTGINTELSRMAASGQPLDVPVSYPEGGHGGSQRLGFGYTAPANLVLFAMINGFVSALTILQLRESGISRRLLAAPRRTWELLAMLAVAPAQQIVAQAVFLILTPRLFFGIHWGDTVGLVLITAAVTSLAVAIVLLMGTVFRTRQQATSLGPWIAVAIGMLGGCMWPLEIVPPFMKTLAHLSPASYAMDAYLGLIFDHATLSEIAPDIAIVFAFAIVIATAGIVRLRPQLSR